MSKSDFEKLLIGSMSVLLLLLVPLVVSTMDFESDSLTQEQQWDKVCAKNGHLPNCPHLSKPMPKGDSTPKWRSDKDTTRPPMTEERLIKARGWDSRQDAHDSYVTLCFFNGENPTEAGFLAFLMTYEKDN